MHNENMYFYYFAKITSIHTFTQTYVSEYAGSSISHSLSLKVYRYTYVLLLAKQPSMRTHDSVLTAHQTSLVYTRERAKFMLEYHSSFLASPNLEQPEMPKRTLSNVIKDTPFPPY